MSEKENADERIALLEQQVETLRADVSALSKALLETNKLIGELAVALK